MPARHLLIAGKSDELARALRRLEGRGLDRGLLASMLEKTRQKHVATQRYPWMSFKCGVFALDELATHAGWKYDRQRLLDSRSGADGLSVAELLSIATAHGLPVIAVQDTASAPVPSVAHFRDGHFVALLAIRDSAYLIFDPGAKRRLWVPSEDFLEEASGIYIGDREQLAGWTLLPDALARATRGRTTSCPPDDTDDQDCQPSGIADGILWNDCAEDDPCASAEGSDSNSSSCIGALEFLGGSRLTSQPHVALKLQDRPLIHQPTRGPGLIPLIFFKQYMESYSHLWVTGPGSLSLSEAWSCSWFMYATPSADLQIETAEVYLRGARREYSYPAIGQGDSTVSLPHPRDRSWLVRDIATATVTLHFPSGRHIEFAGPVPSTSALSNLKAVSRVINRNGEAVEFFYDNDKYLSNLRDADGRYARFTYTRFDDDQQMDAGKFLTGITDAAGIVSTISYPSPGSPAYTYDASGNLTLIDYPAPTVDLTYTYDDKSRLASVVQSGLGTISFANANGRLTEESGPWANTLVRWNYPVAQFRQSSLQVRQNSNSGQDWVQAYTYDTAGRLGTLSPPLGNFTYSYTAAPGASGFAGALIDQVQLPGGGKINHDWDSLGRLTLTEFRNNTNLLQNEHRYQYDTAVSLPVPPDTNPAQERGHPMRSTMPTEEATLPSFPLRSTRAPRPDTPTTPTGAACRRQALSPPPTSIDSAARNSTLPPASTIAASGSTILRLNDGSTGIRWGRRVESICMGLLEMGHSGRSIQTDYARLLYPQSGCL